LVILLAAVIGLMGFAEASANQTITEGSLVIP
jgi:hypothetical protein